MDRSLDYFLAIAALIIGVMLLTGNGGIFMKGGNEQLHRQLYDEKKAGKGLRFCNDRCRHCYGCQCLYNGNGGETGLYCRSFDYIRNIVLLYENKM